jgi:hypothetical protein
LRERRQQPAGLPDFHLQRVIGGDSIINGLPVTSPIQAIETGSNLPDLGLAKIMFSFSWLAMGSTTTPQTIFFDAPGGGVSAVLNFLYSREGLDETNVSGYVIASETPVSAADLENDGISPTGSASAGAPFNFPNTDISATFQPGVPESSTWAMLLIGFVALGYASLRRRGKTVSTA